MTPTKLQDSLVDDFKQQLAGFLLKNSKGDRVNLNIYPQNLPAIKGQKDSEYFPYVVIRVMEGESKDDQGEEENTCKIAFIAGVYDEDDNYQGYKDVMNVTEKIKQRLKTKKFYDNQFELTLPLKWLIHDEDTYPYYFGGIETNWKIPDIGMDDLLI
jgi:hypothetical protein